MYGFEMHRATSVADATATLARSGGKALAGGQSLVAAMKLRLAQPLQEADLEQRGAGLLRPELLLELGVQRAEEMRIEEQAGVAHPERVGVEAECLERALPGRRRRLPPSSR